MTQRAMRRAIAIWCERWYERHSCNLLDLFDMVTHSGHRRALPAIQLAGCFVRSYTLYEYCQACGTCYREGRNQAR
jgi:hypothetical protein